MFKVTYRNILAHKLRLLMTTIAVIAGVSFITGTYIFTDTIGQAFEDVFKALNSKIDILVQSKTAVSSDRALPGSDRPLLTPSALDAIKKVNGVAQAEGLVLGYAQIFDKHNKPLATGFAPTLGTSWITTDSLRAAELKSGHPPIANDEVVIDATSAKQGKYRVGDLITIQFPSQRAQLRLAGIVTLAGSNDIAGASYASFNSQSAQKYLERNGNFAVIEISVAKTSNITDTIAAIRQVVPASVDVIPGNVAGRQTAN